MKQRKEGTHMRNEGENENERYNNNNKNVQQLTAKNRNNVFHELAPVMNYRTRIRTDEKRKGWQKERIFSKEHCSFIKRRILVFLINDCSKRMKNLLFKFLFSKQTQTRRKHTHTHTRVCSVFCSRIHIYNKQ